MEQSTIAIGHFKVLLSIAENGHLSISLESLDGTALLPLPNSQELAMDVGLCVSTAGLEAEQLRKAEESTQIQLHDGSQMAPLSQVAPRVDSVRKFQLKLDTPAERTGTVPATVLLTKGAHLYSWAQSGLFLARLEGEWQEVILPESLVRLQRNDDDSWELYFNEVVLEAKPAPSMQEFKLVPKDNTGTRQFMLVQDVVGRDNCYNSPAKIQLIKGDLLSTTDDYSTRSGHLFFKLNNTMVSVTLPLSAYHSRYPGDSGTFNSAILAPVPVTPSTLHPQ
ncbi:MAG: hypothetical protein Q7U16_12255 [Agitococcus sp.]|nr:hypothetical protein [Agitococcus sp.]